MIEIPPRDLRRTAGFRGLRAVLAAGMVLSLFPARSVWAAQDNGRPQPQPLSQPVVEDDPAQPTAINEGAAVPPPPPAVPGSEPLPDAAAAPAPAPAADTAAPRNGARRQPVGGQVTLGFEDVTINQFIPFIVESTGKIVILPSASAQQLGARKITLVNDAPIDRSAALDFIFRAFRLNGIGVIERDEVIVLYDLGLGNVQDQDLIKTAPVLGPDVDIFARRDLGTLIIKFYRLKFRDAEGIVEQLEKSKPTYATLSADVNSSQVVLLGDIDLAQQMQRLINQLDVPPGNVMVRTFKLRYADAGAIEENILDLFETDGTPGARPGANQTAQQRRAQEAAARAAQGRPVGGTGAGPAVELRTTVVSQQNAITVSGDPGTVEQIAHLIETYWDLELSPKAVKIYPLKFVDPLKVRDKLQSMFGGGGGAAATPGRTGQQPRPPGGQQGGTTAEQLVSGIYQIEAYPDHNSLIVISKTQESLAFLDSIIMQLDMPLNPNKPETIPLKHADALDVAEIINALFAETGAGTGIRVPDVGLQQTTALSSGSSTEGLTGGAAAGAGAGAAGTSQPGRLDLPWVRGRPRDDQDKQTEPSPIIGKVRVVPIFRQNAVMVLAQPEYRDSVRQVIETLDRPGRQVMISAIVAEVELTDEFAFGLRFSSDTIVPISPDNAIAASVGFANERENMFSEFFTTSTLTVDADINALLQALSQKTNIRILQEPRVFTADNQEALFFDGQEIPFISQSQTTDTGALNQSTEYKDVGVQLSVRPRITVQHDVDMEINLLLSNVVAGQTLFGAAIVNKRQTRSKLIVRNGQTIVLSGILREEESKITRGLPFLSDIPLIGELFKSHENATRRTELVAFITPIVVENPSENDDNFNRQERQRLDQLGRPLEEQLKDPEAKDTIRRRIVPGSFPEAEKEPAFKPSRKSPYEP